jgi:hypothetical protein
VTLPLITVFDVYPEGTNKVRPLAPPGRIPNVDPEDVCAPGVPPEPKLVGYVSDAPPYSSTVVSGPTAQIAVDVLKPELIV